MKMETPIVLGVLSFIVAIVGAVYTGRNASRANKIAQGNQQLQWAQQAMNEAKSAKDDAASAKSEAREARNEAAGARASATAAKEDLDAARRETRLMTEQIVGVMDWVDRVVRYAAAMRTEQVSDPATIRLLAIINGGPPEISGAQLRRTERDN